MTNMPFTKTAAAKFVANAVVSGTANHAATTVITNHTDHDEDDMIVRIPTALFGWYVGSKLRPLTDAAVDKTVERYQSWETARWLKKNTEEK